MVGKNGIPLPFYFTLLPLQLSFKIFIGCLYIFFSKLPHQALCPMKSILLQVIKTHSGAWTRRTVFFYPWMCVNLVREFQINML